MDECKACETGDESLKHTCKCEACEGAEGDHTCGMDEGEKEDE